MPDLNSRIRKIIFYSVHILIQIYPKIKVNLS